MESSIQSEPLVRKSQWLGVAVLLACAAGSGILHFLTALTPYIAAGGILWGSVLLALEPRVKRRTPELRGAIIAVGVITTVGLVLFATS